MFQVFKNFTKAITAEFRELDAKRRVETRLLALLQKTSVIEYTAAFRVKAAKTNLS